MESLNEYVKRTLQESAKTAEGSPDPEAQPGASPAAVAEFPSEPFPCPACGQMLAPSCRVCVACKHAIDPAEIAPLQEAALPAVPLPAPGPRPQPVRFPWRLLLAYIGVSFLLAIIFEGTLGEQKAQLAMGGVQTLAGVWVFLDALRHRVPRPLRWAVGSMVLPVVIFPWYLARRRKLESPVPFVEAEVGPVTRFLLFALLVFFLVSVVFYLIQNPPPAHGPAPAPREHKSVDASKGRITSLRSWKGDFRLIRERQNGRLGAGAWRLQAETSAPSDARQTYISPLRPSAFS
ncbi:MAG TPA: hypothetical protein VMO17_16990 [Terriglobia bacterium]|nr:hypothetical protein [Terriglobia bacterium]